MLGIVAVFWAVQNASTARAGAWIGWTAGTAYFAVTLHWITQPFHVDAAAHGWMAPFALILMAGGLALFWAGAGWAAGRVAARWHRAVLFALALSLMEMARAFVFTGFPWGMLAAIWLDTPLSAWLGWIGPHGLGLVSTVVLAALVTPGLRWLGTLGGGALIGVSIVFGPTAPQIPDTAPVIRLVQPNAPQHLKWDPEWTPIFYHRQINATAAPGTPDLTVWPEAAVALTLPRDQIELSQIAKAARGRPVVLGLNQFDGRRVFNTVIALGPDGVVTTGYAKSRLVPFGEYIPFGALLGRFGVQGLADTEGGGYSRGTGPRLMDLSPLGLALPLICYEAVFPNFGRALSAKARMMLHLTNDAWFGTFAGPQQHLAIARMRAAERGLPVIRVANTGVSAIIDATGAVTGQIALNTEGSVDLPLPPRLAPTLYVTWAEWPFIALWGAFAALAAGATLRQKIDAARRQV